MKNNLRRFNLIIKLIGIDNIYQADFNRRGVTIFASDSPEMTQWLTKYKFVKKEAPGWNINKWTRGNYQVILH
jgi:hypothetical protein